MSGLRVFLCLVVGAGVVFMAYVAAAWAKNWYRSIVEQIDQERIAQGRPQPWRYQ